MEGAFAATGVCLGGGGERGGEGAVVIHLQPHCWKRQRQGAWVFFGCFCRLFSLHSLPLPPPPQLTSP